MLSCGSELVDFCKKLPAPAGWSSCDPSLYGMHLLMQNIQKYFVWESG